MERISKIKAHFKRNSKIYLAFGSGVAFAGITFIVMRESHTKPVAGLDCPERESMGSFNFSKSIFGNATTNVVATTHNGTRGNPGFLTQCVDTEEVFGTQAAAAKAFGIPEDILSKHLNHGRDLAEGISFKRLGVIDPE